MLVGKIGFSPMLQSTYRIQEYTEYRRAEIGILVDFIKLV